MRKTPFFILGCVLLACITPAVAGTVTVSFIHPETYTDASLSGGHTTKADQWTFDEIGRYLESLGARLPPQQVLTLDVSNVDLAGKIEWWRRRDAYNLRILRDVYPPRFRLHHRLAEGGRTLLEAEESVVDPMYLANSALYFTPTDPLRFEKAMLRNWFQARFTDPPTHVTLR
jgi:Protein of unknown function (DUF3016)